MRTFISKVWNLQVVQLKTAKARTISLIMVSEVGRVEGDGSLPPTVRDPQCPGISWSVFLYIHCLPSHLWHFIAKVWSHHYTGSEVKVRSLYTGFLFLSFWRTFGIFFYYVSASNVIVYASIFSPNLYTCKR